MEITRAITIAERNQISIKQLDKKGFYLLCHKSGKIFLNEFLLLKLLLHYIGLNDNTAVNFGEKLVDKLNRLIAEEDFTDFIHIINNDAFFSKLKLKILTSGIFTLYIL